MLEVRRLSLRTRLLLMLLVTVVGSQLAMGLLGRRYARSHMEADAQRELELRLRESVAPVADRIATVCAALRLIAASSASPQEAAELAKSLLPAIPEVRAVEIVEPRGGLVHVFRSDDRGIQRSTAPTGSPATEAWITGGVGAGGRWTIAAQLLPELLAGLPRGGAPPPADEAIVVTTKDGAVLWQWPPQPSGGAARPEGAGEPARPLRDALAEFAAGTAFEPAMARSTGSTAIAVAHLDEAGVFAGIRTAMPPGAVAAVGFQFAFWGILAITPLLAAWLAYRFSRWISLRIGRISDTVDAVAQGDLDRTVSDEGGSDDELAKLGRAVNAMTASLRAHRSALEAQRLRLAEALREVESLDRLKDSFLALVSHEVRTPLTSILGGIELLNDGSYRTRSADEITLLEIVHDGCKRLASFMNDAILMASLQASRARTGYEEVSVTALVDRQLAELSAAIAEKRLTLHNDVDQRGEIVTWGDWTLLQVAVRKVLENAVMHNVDGGQLRLEIVEQTFEIPAVSLQRLQAQRGRTSPRPNMQWRALRVYNTGPVIPADKLWALFQRFELVHDVANHQRGSGLSLPIAAQVLHQHEGAVEVRQVGESGMAFYLVLPMRERALAADRRDDLPAGIDNLVESALTLAPRRLTQPRVASALAATGGDAAAALGGEPVATCGAPTEPVLPAL